LLFYSVSGNANSMGVTLVEITANLSG
jgi:hypothetical protein